MFNRKLQIFGLIIYMSVSQFRFLKGSSSQEQCMPILREKFTLILSTSTWLKAHYSVSHSILLSKLQIMGIFGPLINWLSVSQLVECFLNSRSQLLYVNGQYSDILLVPLKSHKGASYRSIIVFVYINDLPGFELFNYCDHSCLLI